MTVLRPFPVIEIAPRPPDGAPRTATSLAPALPGSLMGVLAPERRQVSMQRWAEGHSNGGWVVQRNQGGQIARQFLDDTGPRYWEQRFRTHVPTRAWGSEHRDLLWVEPAGSDAPSPALPEGRSMLDDRLVDARVPVVWASWGPGSPNERGDGSTAISDGSVLNLYSDEARTVRLVVDGRSRGCPLVWWTRRTGTATWMRRRPPRRQRHDGRGASAGRRAPDWRSGWQVRPVASRRWSGPSRSPAPFRTLYHPLA